MNQIQFPKEYTLQRLSEKGHTISFSRWNRWRECPFSMFSSYLLSPLVLEENTFALPGWMIQKILELWINGQQWKNGSDFIFASVRPLFDLVAFPFEAQVSIDRRDYFSSPEGRARVSKFVSEGGLSPLFLQTDLQPFFISEERFLSVNRSCEKFFERLSRIFTGLLDMWGRDNIDLSLMKCEVPFEMDFMGFRVSGRADFIYGNPPDCTILDGKYNLSRFVHQEQLQLYASMMYAASGVYPRWLSFLDYNGLRYRTFQTDPLFLNSTLAPDLLQIYSHIQYIRQTLSSLNRDFFTFDDLPLIRFRPSDTSCAFCPLRDEVCPTPRPADRVELFRSRMNRQNVAKEFRGIDPTTIGYGTL